MKTSDAEKYGQRCPRCKRRLAQDRVGRGFVRHLGPNRKRADVDPAQPHLACPKGLRARD